MATAADRDEFGRLSTSGTPVVPVIELPKLAEEMAAYLPRAAGALRTWDEKMEIWRKSILFGGGDGGGSIIQFGTASPAAPGAAPDVLQYHGLLDGNLHTDTVIQAPSVGSIVYVNDNATPKWDELPIGEENAVLRSDGDVPYWDLDSGVFTVVLQESVATHMPVTVDGYNADSDDDSQVQKLAGISLEDGIAGDTIKVRRLGIETFGTWTWTPSSPLFITGSGLSHTPPSDGWTQRVGLALTATRVFVNPAEPILLQ